MSKLNYMRSLLFIGAMACMTSTVKAQNTESAYFIDGSVYRHDLNPAFGNNKSYFSMPVLGNLNVGLSGNLGVNALLYDKNNELLDFMSDEITKEELMKNLNDENEINQELKLQLLSFGIKAGKGYATVELNVREKLTAKLPRSLFDMLKSDIGNEGEYEINDVRLHADALAEVAVGYSHQINDRLRIGGKLKALMGGANVDLLVESLKLAYDNENNIMASAKGEIQASAAGLAIKENESGNITGVEYDNPGMGGFGMAVDLGAELKLTDHFKVSAAVLDLGTIKWNNNYKGTLYAKSNLDDFEYDIENDTYVNNSGDNIEDNTDAFRVRNDGDAGSRMRKLGATFNVGVEYAAHFYDKLKFGLLNTTRVQGKYTWTDTRLSANLVPNKWFGLGINASTGTYGTSVGWILDIHPKGIGLFIAMDKMVTKFSNQYIPQSCNAEVAMGINFLF